MRDCVPVAVVGGRGEGEGDGWGLDRGGVEGGVLFSETSGIVGGCTISSSSRSKLAGSELLATIERRTRERTSEPRK